MKRKSQVKSAQGNSARALPGSVRIIGGQWRGRKLPVPVVEGLRPTPNRIRETLFNWLQPWIEGADCLDLSAGTGSLCFESLSRGASGAVLIESSHTAVNQIRENLKLLNASNAIVLEESAHQYLQGQVQQFDIIFLDPPFKSNLIVTCFALINERVWLKPGGLLYIEAPAKSELPDLPAGWSLFRSKTSGEVGYHLLKFNGSAVIATEEIVKNG